VALGISRVAETAVGCAELLVQLDQRAFLQHVVAGAQKRELAQVLLHRVGVTALAVVDVPEPRVRADDEQPFLA
jgi:hypothetical protein